MFSLVQIINNMDKEGIDITGYLDAATRYAIIADLIVLWAEEQDNEEKTLIVNDINELIEEIL